MWWEDSTGSYKEVIRYEYVNCPVCRASLGKKEKDDSVAFHCNECKTVYTFFPGLKKPTAKLDSDIAHTCSCPSCRANRGEIELEEEKVSYQYDEDE